MKKDFFICATTGLVILLLCLLSSRYTAKADDHLYGYGWTPVYFEFPDPAVLYVECIETNDPEDYCVPTGYNGPIQQ